MRPWTALAAAVAVCAGACGDGPTDAGPRWVGLWTLDRDRTARAVVDYNLAEREKMSRMMGGGGARPGPEAGPETLRRRGDPSDEEMLRQVGLWLQGMTAEIELKADGSARTDLFLGGTKTLYAGTWVEVGDGAEVRITSRVDGVLLDRDVIPLRLRRDGEFLVIGDEKDAKGEPRPVTETNTVVTARPMYLSRK